MKIKVSVLLVLLLAIGWYQTAQVVIGTPVRIREHIERAQTFEKKEIYEDALEEYKAAVALGETDGSIRRKVAEMYLQLEETPSFIASCEALIYGKQLDEKALEMLISYYDADGKKADAVALLKELGKTQPENETVKKLWKQYRGYYEETSNSYDEVTPYYQGYSIVTYEGRFGLVNAKGESVIPAAYEAVGFLSGENAVVPVCEDGAWYYLNTKIHKKIVPDDAYDFLGVISDDTVLVRKDGKYGFADVNIAPKTKLQWEDASNLHQGVAAVKSGGKWALIDDAFDLVTEYVYEDVKRNESGFCSNQKRIFAKGKEGYGMWDEEGKRVGEAWFEDARPFETDELAAVKKDGKWGFVNTSGALVIDCQYEDARSFTQGVAAVKKDGAWGYIDASNATVIAPTFEDAYPFCESGMAPVKNEYWHFIRLCALAS